MTQPLGSNVPPPPRPGVPPTCTECGYTYCRHRPRWVPQVRYHEVRDVFEARVVAREDPDRAWYVDRSIHPDGRYGSTSDERHAHGFDTRRQATRAARRLAKEMNRTFERSERYRAARDWGSV